MTPKAEPKPPDPSPPPAPSPEPDHSPAPAKAEKNNGLKLPNIKKSLPRFYKKFAKHAVFAAVLLVLLVYILVVFKISQLSSAEPTAEQSSSTTALIPKINQNAINQIQSLENNNTQIHTLFEQARNNPFQE